MNPAATTPFASREQARSNNGIVKIREPSQIICYPLDFPDFRANLFG